MDTLETLEKYGQKLIQNIEDEMRGNPHCQLLSYDTIMLFAGKYTEYQILF